MNTAGWLLTESGRQPWIVQGLQLTKNGVSPSVGIHHLVISLVIFVAALRRAWRRGPGAHAAVLAPRSRLGPVPSRTDGRAGHPRALDAVLTEGSRAMTLARSGSSSSPCCGPASSCWRGSTSGSACCTAWSAATRPGGAPVINTIGPLWDGNEVWLIVAGAPCSPPSPAGTRPCSPALYLALVLLLVGADRARHVASSSAASATAPRWRRIWGGLLTGGSLLAPAADRHRAGRPAARAADRHEPGVHRDVLGPAAALRASTPASPWSRSASCTARRSSR